MKGTETGVRALRKAFLMALLLFLCVVWCVADALLGLTLPAAKTVRIPVLVGLSEGAAADYPFLDVTADYCHDDSPAGTILAQRPVGGSLRRVSDGGIPLRLTVSLGQAAAEIPALFGADAAAAAGELRSLGLTVEVVRLPGGAAGTVARTEPSAGVRVVVGAVVRLYVHAGDSARTVSVPDLSGMTRGEAILTVLRAGLSVDEVPTVSPGAVVCAQSPAPGSIVTSGSRVRLEFEGEG